MNEQSRLRLTRKDQLMFINGSKVAGLQSCNFQNNYSANRIPIMQQVKLTYGYEQEQIGIISLNKLLLDKDFLWNVTGLAPLDGFLLQNTNNTINNIAFNSGVITKYSLNASLGQIPEINVEINSYGNFGRLSGIEGTGIVNDLFLVSQTPTGVFPYILLGPVQLTSSSNSYSTISGYNYISLLKTGDIVQIKSSTQTITGLATGFNNASFFIKSGVSAATQQGYAFKQEDVRPIGPGSLSININNITGNPIESIDFDVNFPINPIYTLGSLTPDLLLMTREPEVNLSINLILDEYLLSRVTSYPVSTGLYNQDIEIEFRDYNNTLIQSYYFPKMHLVSEEYSSSVNDNTFVTLTYTTSLVN